MLLEYAFDGRRRAVSFSSARWASACRRSIRSTQRGWSLFSRPRTIALEHDRPECGDASDDTNAQFTPRRLMQRSGALLLMTAGVGHLTRLGSVRPQAHPTIDISIYVHIVTSSSPRQTRRDTLGRDASRGAFARTSADFLLRCSTAPSSP
jgi:hypothetical protein